MLKRDILISFCGQTSRLIFAIIGSTLLARGLGPDGQGLYALAIWMPMAISMFAQFGQAQVNATFAGLYKDKRRALFLQTLIIASIFGALGFLVMFAYFFWLPIPHGKFGDIPRYIIILSAFLIPIVSLDSMFRELVRGAERIYLATLITTIGFAVRATAFFFFIFIFRMGLMMAICITLIIPLLTTLGYTWSVRDFANIKFKWLSYSLMKKSLRLGFVFMMSTSAIFLVHSVATLLMGYMELSEKEIGFFAVALMFTQQMGIIPTSISEAFLPRLSNNPGERLKQTPKIFRLTLITCFFCMIGLLFFGCPVILILLGWDYLGSIPAIIAMLPGLTVFGAIRILGINLWVLEKPLYGLVNNWITLLVTIILCLVMIPPLGILGAGIANSLSLFLLTGLTTIAYQHESCISIRELVPKKGDWAFLYKEMKSNLLQIKAKLPIFG